jgi:uncharacterized membrane protein YvbJ
MAKEKIILFTILTIEIVLIIVFLFAIRNPFSDPKTTGGLRTSSSPVTNARPLPKT